MAEDHSLEARFHQRMLDAYQQTGEAARARGERYWPTRYLQMVRRLGGLQAAKRWLARPDPQVGFGRLQDLTLVHLSIEAIVLDPVFASLFTQDELDTARRRLAQAGSIPGAGDSATGSTPGRRYWAFLANPDVYRILDVIHDLPVDTWTAPNGDVRRGDRVLVWKARGTDHERGVVALGEVLSDPAPMSDAGNRTGCCRRQPTTSRRECASAT